MTHMKHSLKLTVVWISDYLSLLPGLMRLQTGFFEQRIFFILCFAEIIICDQSTGPSVPPSKRKTLYMYTKVPTLTSIQSHVSCSSTVLSPISRAVEKLYPDACQKIEKTPPPLLVIGFNDNVTVIVYYDL